VLPDVRDRAWSLTATTKTLREVRHGSLIERHATRQRVPLRFQCAPLLSGREE
jgi:hypothetical protein